MDIDVRWFVVSAFFWLADLYVATQFWRAHMLVDEIAHVFAGIAIGAMALGFGLSVTHAIVIALALSIVWEAYEFIRYPLWLFAPDDTLNAWLDDTLSDTALVMAAAWATVRFEIA